MRDADPDGDGCRVTSSCNVAAYLRCGALANGSVRVRWQACHHEISTCPLLRGFR